MISRLVLSFAILLMPVAALAQGTPIALSGLDQESDLPVEVSAEKLEVNQNDGSARFTGNVIVVQGDMRMSAPIVDVNYSNDEGNTGGIERIHAQGGVTMVTAEEAAESRDAVYTVGDGMVVMTGDVILTQGNNALASERMVVNLDDGSGVMTGRVRVIFQSGGDQ